MQLTFLLNTLTTSNHGIVGLGPWRSNDLIRFPSPLPVLWWNVMETGMAVTVVVAYLVIPFLLGCVLVIVYNLYQVKKIRSMFLWVMLLISTPFLYPPCIVYLSWILWMSLSAIIIAIVAVGPPVLAVGLTKKLISETSQFVQSQQEIQRTIPVDIHRSKSNQNEYSCRFWWELQLVFAPC